MEQIIDAHHHFWKTAAQEQPWRTHAHSALERDFEPSDLIPELDRAGIDGTVVMQSVDEPAENDRLAIYAKERRVAGIVAWLPIKRPDTALMELDRNGIGKLCGVRCLIADDPLDWLTQPAAIDLFRAIAARDIAWDVVPITIAQTKQVIALARAVPELRIVIDHLGRPPIDSLGWEPWAKHIQELALCPNVAIKLSVGIDALTQWSSWSPEDLHPYVTFVCEKFGSDRLMLASNWPVVLLRTSYANAWRDLTTLAVKQFSTQPERADVLGASAKRWYHLADVPVPRKEVRPTTD